MRYMSEAAPAEMLVAGEFDFAQPLKSLHDTLQGIFLDPNDRAGSIASQRANLESIVAAAHGTNLSADGHTMLDHYATALDYMWFGGHRDDPPAAMKFVWAGYSDHREDWGTVTFNEEALDEHAFEAATHLLMSCGLGDLLKQRQTHAGANKQALYDTFAKVIDSTPGGGWFAAFDAANSYSAMPPTNLQKLTHRATLTEAALRTHDRDAHSSQLPSANGQRWIEHHMRLYEEETVERRSRGSSDIALRGLQQYVDRAMIESGRPTNAVVAEQSYDLESHAFTETYTDGSSERYDLCMIGFDDADRTKLPTAANNALDTFSRETYVEAFVNAHKDTPQSYQAARSNVFSYLHEQFLHGFVDGMNVVNARSVDNLLEYCKLPRDDLEFSMANASEISTKAHYEMESVETPHHISESGFEAERKTLIATVEKYNNPVPGAARLLQQAYWLESENVAIGKDACNPDDADLILTLSKFTGHPAIPGYELAGLDPLERRYYFKYLPDNDPYVPDQTPLTPEEYNTLMDAATEAGYGELADALDQLQHVTPAQLAKLSQAAGIYAFRKTFEADFGPALTSLRAFRLLMQHEQLRGTCEIFAKLGALVQEQLWPSDNHFITNGYVLTKDISGVTHAQVVRIKQDGKKSISEWTPSLARGFIGSTANVQGVTVQPQSAMPQLSAPPVTLRQMVDASLTSLLGQLSGVFMPELGATMPRDAIFERVKQLGHGHVIAKSLGALANAAAAFETNANLPDTEVQGLLAADAKVQQERALTARRQHNRPDLDILEARLHSVLDHTDLGEQVLRLTQRALE